MIVGAGRESAAGDGTGIGDRADGGQIDGKIRTGTQGEDLLGTRRPDADVASIKDGRVVVGDSTSGGGI